MVLSEIVEVPARLALKLLRFWKTWISPYLGQHCRFHPTCSVYTAQAIERFGLLRGTFIGAKRILRCNPFCDGGADPLDERPGEKFRANAVTEHKGAQ